jgi:hypothetical protein
MNAAVIRSLLVYFFTLLSVGVLNIDSVISWYGSKGAGHEEILRGLTQVKLIRMESGIGSWLDRFECAAGFAFEGSYKDKSRCQGDAAGTALVSRKEPAVHAPALEEERKHQLLPAPGPLQETLPKARAESSALEHTEARHESERLTEAWWETETPGRSGPQRDNRIGPQTSLRSADEKPGNEQTQAGNEPELIGGNQVEWVPEAAVELRLVGDQRGVDEPASAEGVRAANAFDPLPGKPIEDKLAAEKLLAAVREESEVGPADGPASDSSREGETLGKTMIQSVLLVGDSLAHGLAVSLGPDLKDRTGTAFSCFSKVSSGLNNPNVLDWEKTIRTLLRNGPPNLVLVMMGVNDANNHIREGNRLCVVGTPEWAQAYENKVENFLHIVSASHARVFWIGVPVVREEQLQHRVYVANMAARNACGKLENCCFIDTSEALCDENRKYTNYLKESNGSSIRIRAKDGIHFSMAGSNLLARYILLKLEDADSGSSSARN